MDAQTLVDMLGELSFSSVFPQPIIAALATHANFRRVPAGTTLFREGEKNELFYVVYSGEVVLEMCVPARGCTRLMSLGPGDILAWSALVGGEQMTAAAIAQSDTELIEISGPELLKLCEADHELGYRLMQRLAKALSKRLVATRLQLLDLFAAEAKHNAGGSP